MDALPPSQVVEVGGKRVGGVAHGGVVGTHDRCQVSKGGRSVLS